MSWFRRLRDTITGFPLDRELDDELRFHLESRIDEYISSGMSPGEARREALRRFGSPDLSKERTRDMDVIEWLDSVRRDLIYGWRAMWRTPGITITAILSLALGIGANTAIFSVMNAMMFKMLPVRQAEQLEQITWGAPKYPEKLIEQDRGSNTEDSSGAFWADYFSYSLFERLRAPNAAFESVFGHVKFHEKANIIVNGRGEVAEGQFVTGGYFQGLGVQPFLGRLVDIQDDRDGAPPAAVISHRYWQKRFGGDSSAVGKMVRINEVPVTVVGITPGEFFGISAGESPDFFLPLHMQPQIVPRWAEPGKSMFLDDKNWWIQLMGRRRSGVSEEQARATLTALFQNSLPIQLKQEDRPNIRLTPAAYGLDELRSRFSKPLMILMAIVGLVLLIACANVANLLLAQSNARQREAAMRYALGAGRRRLIRQMFIESLLLAIQGGALGFAVAQWAGEVLVAMVPGRGMPVVLPVGPDWHVIGFTALISLTTCILFGLAPALRASRTDLNSALKESRRLTTGRRLSGKVLVAAQMTISLLLLVVAGLFLRSLANLNSVDLGFQRDHVLLFTSDPSLAGYQEKNMAGILSRVLEIIRSLPGVRSASLSTQRLISDRSMIIGIEVPEPKSASPKEERAWILTVDPGFFETMRIPLLNGRLINDRDGERTPRVAVANETFAKQFFAGASPIGRTLQIGIREKMPYEIVGMVKDAHYHRVRDKTPPILYYSYRQHMDYVRRVHFEVRTAGDPLSVFPAVRRAIEDIDPRLPLFDITTQSAQIDDNLKLERLFAKLAGCFGALALVLAMIGLYGVQSYGVSRRTGEIGVRLALGANRSSVLGMVMRESALVIAAGLTAGLGLAYATTRILVSVLYDLKPNDPVTFVAAVIVLLGASILAAWIPARRASKVDPMIALRHE